MYYIYIYTYIHIYITYMLYIYIILYIYIYYIYSTYIVCVFGTKKNLEQVGSYFFYYYFSYAKSIWNTEAKLRSYIILVTLNSNEDANF